MESLDSPDVAAWVAAQNAVTNAHLATLPLTGGKLWATEYGISSDPRQFAFLIKYSPLHNVTPDTCYPATLITTADHDDRVVPSHSFKFAVALQAAHGWERPVLIRVEIQGSHGYRPTDRLIAERADQRAFAAAYLHLT